MAFVLMHESDSGEVVLYKMDSGSNTTNRNLAAEFPTEEAAYQARRELGGGGTPWFDPASPAQVARALENQKSFLEYKKNKKGRKDASQTTRKDSQPLSTNEKLQRITRAFDRIADKLDKLEARK